MTSAGLRVAVATALCLWVCERARAVQITLNVVQSQSSLTLNGGYVGNPFFAQDDPNFPTPDTTDGDLNHPSNRTTLSGTITVEVDNPMAPSTIQLLSASIDASTTGDWLPEPQPEDGQPSEGTDPQPAAPADIGIKLVADFGIPQCCDIAYAVLRDVNYNLVTADYETEAPIVEPVNSQGEFSSLSQILTYNTAFFEYWADPFLINERERDDVSGDGAPNHHEVDASTETITPIANAPLSTYIVSGGIATLTIPIDINVDNPSDLSQFVDGQIVATFALSTGLEGDHNMDGVVDAADYVAWRKTDIGGAQGYLDWQANFGESQSGAAGGVPEPAGGALVLIAFSATSLFLRRRSGS